MESLPDLRTNIAKDRRTVVIFDDQVRRLVNEYVETPDEFYASLRKIVSPIRKEIFDMKNKFDGHFDPKCQLNSVPKRLLLMISALIDGSSETNGCNFSQETLTTAQLIMSHTRKFEKKHMPEKLIRRRHSKNQETPIMLHNSLKIYATTDRSRNLIDHFFRLGLCVSYDRVLEITKDIYENLRESFFSYNCFFPNILKKKLFTVLLKDNIDVNARSNFVNSHYHGTSISIIQFVTNEDKGVDFPEIDISNNISTKSKKLSPLPGEYINVQKLFSEEKTRVNELWAPLCSVNISAESAFVVMENAVSEEARWLDLVARGLREPSNENETSLPGWARYHASFKRREVDPPGINTISPLLRDKVHTLNMQAHCMLLNISSTKILNEDQTPVDTCDEPLFALSKEAQYRYPKLFSNYVVLFGALHIEQSLLGIHGQLIDGSGLLLILNQLKFTTVGLPGLSIAADVSSIKRVRYCVQVTCALYSKLTEAVVADESSN